MARKRPQDSRRSGRDSRGGGGLDRQYLAAMSEIGDEASSGEEGESAGDHMVAIGEGPVRHAFGAGNVARLVLEVSDDGLKAIVRELTFGGDTSLGSADLMAVLLDQGRISKSFLDLSRVEQLGRRAANTPSRVVRPDSVVARGSPPVQGEPARIQYPYLGGAAAPSGRAGADLRGALEQTDLQAVLAAGPTCQLVVPDEELVRVQPPSGATPGRDVRGELISPRDGDTDLRAGRGVELRGQSLVASRYGYACVEEPVISVLCPIWISPDRMEGHFVHFAQVRATDPPESTWVMEWLEELGVRTGIEEAALERLCKFGVEPGRREAFLLVRGTPPVDGTDTHLDFAIDLEKRAGHVLPDGSIDLRERNAAVGVAEDQLVATLVPHRLGQPGTDVGGVELPASDGEEKEFGAGENVRTETEGDQVKFISEVDGAAVFKGDSLSVNTIHVVNGDVNYDTGNIDVQGDVQIGGSIGPGFTVKAGGTVSVGGTIEPGAEVRARADVVAGRGILGDSTRVVALGNVETKFIQGSAVMAQGDVSVGSYVFNAQVRAGGHVVVGSGGGGRAGSIVGGEAVATKGVEARILGSPSTDLTVVGIGADPETQARLGKARKAIDHCDTYISRILRTLGMESIDAGRIEEAARRASPARRAQLAEMLKKLKELATSREKAETLVQELEEQISEALTEAQVQVSEMAHAGVQISFADQRWDVAEDTAKPVFSMTEEGLRFRPA